MGISRDSRHKRSATGAKRSTYRKKRAFELGRQSANTRIGTKRIHLVRTRGGNRKFRAIRLEAGNFSWGSEGISKKTRVIGVVFHPSNNEYEAHYGLPLGKKRGGAAKTDSAKAEETAPATKSKSVQRKLAARASTAKVESTLETQFAAGRLYAAISSRPGQSGRADGYILEGEELAFYQRQLRK
ncbi:unnamed protein product [Tuber aestivum]|uniref:40S ribosomal protein S8 n=1 Tax=Tuber aestivum TaxID=59557 RepID=A0A292PKP1_9PEZI|nr:unnamed protein product [Tuber aestivum]